MRDSVPLRDVIADARPGFACGEIDPDGTIQIRMNNVSSDGALIFDSLRRVPRDAGASDRFKVDIGDVLFNATNSPELVGKSALFRGYPEPVVYSNHFIRLRSAISRLDSGYLSKWLHMVWRRGDFSRMCKQWVNQASVASDRLLSLEIPLPPLPAQRRIAAILDKADQLRAKRRAALERLSGLTEAVFFATYASERHHWTEETVESLAAQRPNAIRTGPFGSQLLHSEFVGEGIAVLGIDNAVRNTFVRGRPRFISERKYRQLERYTVRPGDVLITIMGTCGRCAVVPDDVGKAINTKHLCCITLDQSRCLPSYFHASLLMDPTVRRQLGVRERGAVMPGLNMGLIKQLRISLPPLAVQQEHERMQQSIARIRTLQEESSGHLDALFDSLQHRAFAGML